MKEHWEKIYSTKQRQEMSWVQEYPQISMYFIHTLGLSKQASIIDIGGGDSKLVDWLLDEGYEDITVLDISQQSLLRVQNRLGEKAKKVKWIVSDVMDFESDKSFDFWHDRATFHFLATDIQINRYLDCARRSVKENGFLTIGTFSENGPLKCSGLEIKRYSENTLPAQLENGFEKLKCLVEDHLTPFGTLQNFIFCAFRRFSFQY